VIEAEQNTLVELESRSLKVCREAGSGVKLEDVDLLCRLRYYNRVRCRVDEICGNL
jgi:hypothetical protein